MFARRVVFRAGWQTIEPSRAVCPLFINSSRVDRAVAAVNEVSEASGEACCVALAEPREGHSVSAAVLEFRSCPRDCCRHLRSNGHPIRCLGYRRSRLRAVVDRFIVEQRRATGVHLRDLELAVQCSRRCLPCKFKSDVWNVKTVCDAGLSGCGPWNVGLHSVSPLRFIIAIVGSHCDHLFYMEGLLHPYIMHFTQIPLLFFFFNAVTDRPYRRRLFAYRCPCATKTLYCIWHRLSPGRCPDTPNGIPKRYNQYSEWRYAQSW